MNIPLDFVAIVNIIIIAVVIVSVYLGYKKGVFWQAIKAVGLLAVIMIGYIVSPGLAGAIKLYPESWTPFQGNELFSLFYEKLNIIAWFLVVVVVGFIILALVKPLFKIITEAPIIKQVNAILGALFSLVPVYIILVVLNFVLNTAFITNGKDFIASSLFKYIDSSSKGITIVLNKMFNQNQAIQKLLSDPKSLNIDDLKSIYNWMKNNKVSTESIINFLQKYGISVEDINSLISSIEENSEDIDE